MVCSSHGTKRWDLLITLERVWAVGIFDAGRRLFGFQRAATATSGNKHLPAVFVSQSGLHPSATRQKGVPL